MTRHRHIKGFLAALAIPVLLAACSSGGGTAPLPTIPSQGPATPTHAASHPGPPYPPGYTNEQQDAHDAGETRKI